MRFWFGEQPPRVAASASRRRLGRDICNSGSRRHAEGGPRDPGGPISDGNFRAAAYELRRYHCSQWLKTRKPFGWEVLERRYGGLMRASTRCLRASRLIWTERNPRSPSSR